MGKNIRNGVTTVQFPAVVGIPADRIYQQIDVYSIPLFGRSLDQFDHVMVCMPRGVTVRDSKNVKPHAKSDVCRVKSDAQSDAKPDAKSDSRAKSDAKSYVSHANSDCTQSSDRCL